MKTILVPRGRSLDEPMVYVAVNGKSFLIPKGQKCEVPDYIFEELQRASEADEHYEITVTDLKGKNGTK